MTLSWISDADRNSAWSEANVLVAGLGVSGFATADGLMDVGAAVTVVDSSESESNKEKAHLLEMLDASVRLGEDAQRDDLLTNIDLVVTSPGWRPDTPLLVEAMRRGIPVWGDVELAWRLQHPDRVVPWLGITGTNGKTTTTLMVESILHSAGLKTSAVGNIGRPIMEAILDEENYDVLAVELSSFQLHWSKSLSLHSAAVLNLQPDHLEWYDGDYQAYSADKARIYHQVKQACIYNVADKATEQMVEEADVVEGARAVGFTLGTPSISMVGVVDDLIVDRAFVEQRKDSALELCSIHDVHPFAPHNIENAVAAAALTRSFGVPAQAVRDGLRALEEAPHKIQTVAVHDGITWVDDSKATNPHAADAALRAYDSVVWIAGGQAKGTTFDDLVLRHRDRLRGAVLLGVDQEIIAAALRKNAPEVPIVMIAGSDPDAMSRAVSAAAQLANAGDTVLMSPACASKDIWSGYDARGTDFIVAVQGLK